MVTLGKALEVPGCGDVEMDGGSAFERVQRAVDNVVREGYSATQLLTQVCHPLSLSSMA